MTSAKALFKQMLLQKRRYAHLVLLVQTFAVIFMFFMDLILNHQNSITEFSNTFFRGKSDNPLEIILGLGIMTTIFADIIFTGLLCWQNEKINLSQTWHLVPISDVKLWLINIFSSIAECAYIFIIQVLVGAIVFMLDLGGSLFKEITKIFFKASFWVTVEQFGEQILYLVGLVLVIFTFVSFANLLTRTITDQLPIKNTTTIKLSVMAILVIIAVTIALKLNDQLTMFYIHYAVNDAIANVWDWFRISILEYWIVAIVLGLIDSFLISKFVEPKIVS
ncbi:ABC transporter permease [Lactobacillus acidophilus]|uniref:ABC transporter permease n=1 Tax=Lactobacillus acidophilus TaxID=1579 RepID=UPI001F0A0D44|nr:ABC transporter permease [Lactobacillus acidophilus]MBN3488249.1 ABC transporter permease [Lactobacillus acidophilus]